ncbi:arylamine N-acetyltransferase family protein [Paludifilum halophilum]|uniref:arylamine N-acetyltransferase family protein n=1 Tax=Paludifilum halophilum TaxID=1642702 RepID=UPI00146B8120|nr:arylamine N-acetyltransferase [Paludifilum halophilum]
MTFADLPALQFQFAKTVPFENIDIMVQKNEDLTLENIRKKIIDQKRGGVCYELNPLFYSFLKQQGFDVRMVAATIVHDQDHHDLVGTHITTLLTQEENRYIVDVGFGGNHALQPIPMTGETVTSLTGEYRIREVQTPFGEYAMQKYRDGKLDIQYIFSTEPIDEAHLNMAKDRITDHTDSPFNKSVLLNKLTDDGSITLTNQSFTITRNNRKTRQEVDRDLFKQLCEHRFGIPMTEKMLQLLV